MVLTLRNTVAVMLRTLISIVFGAFFVACDGESPFAVAPDDCTVELEGRCWTLLGLEGASVVEIAATPWGVFAATENGSLFRLDPDRNWHEVGPVGWQGNARVQALVFVPSDPPRLLAGMRAEHPSDTAHPAVHVSTDRGRSWIRSDQGLGGRGASVSDLVVDPDDPQRVFLANNYGVLRSEDRGATWVFVLGGFEFLPAFYSVLLVDSSRPGTVWFGGQTAGFDPSLGISDDLGENWRGGVPRCNGGVPQDAVTALALDPNRRERLWIGMIGGVLWADNGGEARGEWRCGAAPREEFVIDFIERSGELVVITKTYERVYDEDGNPVSLEFSFGPVFQTADGGDTWDAMSVPENAGVPNVRAVDIDPENRVLIGTSSGIWAFTPDG